MSHKTFLTAFLLLILVSPFTLAASSLKVTALRCEYKQNPLGIDIRAPRLSWQMQSVKKNVTQTAWEVRAAHLTADLKAGTNLVWSSGKVNNDQSAHVVWKGSALHSSERIYWQVRIWDNYGQKSAWSDPAWFETGLLSPDDWQARWIRGDLPEDTTTSNPAQYFRSEVNITGRIKSARAYVTSLGLYELHMNGKRVGDAYFTPGWTSYNKRLQYQTYDVTGLIHQGQNAIGAIVGDGWYRGRIGWNGSRNKYGARPGLLVQVLVIYEDGSSKVWGTDEQWKASTGPILMSEIYDGETYDARLEQDGWDMPGFEDTAWKPVKTFTHNKNILIAPESLPVRKMEEVVPVSVLVTPQGDTVVDMGQNMVGWIRLKVSGPGGRTVILRHAEVLDKYGNFYTENLRSAKQTITYILKGGKEEIFEPHFTFQGFRYVAVSGFPGEVKPENLTGIVLHTGFRQTGNFVCSDSLINRLQHNIIWGQKGNFLEVPTDCPQRDERLGWTGDAQVFAPTACFNGDVAAFYTRWMKDFTADQQDQGQIPHVIPDVLSIKNGHKGSSASAGWADAAVIVPWTVYKAYGDKRILEQQYDCMKKWVGYQEKQAGDSYFWKQDFTFGDWLAFSTNRSDYPGATTDKDFITQVYFARSVGLMAKIAGVLGKSEDEKHFQDLRRHITEVFRHEFLTPAGRLSPNTQTAYALALYLNLIPDELKASAAKRLADDVKKFGHLTTGFLGASLLCPVLSDNGYTDVAYMLLNRKDYPSWLYPVTRGATTIWERWDGIKPDSTFQDPGMNSFNHYAYGAIGEWLYNTVAGIRIDEEHPGYKHIIFAPRPGGGLTRASASTESVYGSVAISWKKTNGQMTVEITVPANTTATVKLPGTTTGKIRVGGKPAVKSRFLKNIRQEGNGVTLETGSGNYKFTYPVTE
ncbi:MAG: family 78 glycoside hydrolase catalytic domain [Chlorobi bacterium]|nr:family 78 glycoside hydrolase catalytic domain [Chlorobiota bacterium]